MLLYQLPSTDDDQTCDNPYIELHSRKYKWTKRKISNSFAIEKADQSQLKTLESAQHPKRSVVYGRSSGGDYRINAAKKLVKSSFLYW